MTRDIHQDRILILDFGSQYAQLIARRVRELGVYCELMAADVDTQSIRQFAPKGIILSGGPETVTAGHTPRAPEIVFELGCPVLGICYGMQTMALQMGGAVSGGHHAEFGHATIKVERPNPLLTLTDTTAPTSDELDVWMSHGDRVTELPADFTVICSTATVPIAGMMHVSAPYYALQFHPEVTHTAQGQVILSNFVHSICQCHADWQPAAIVDESVAAIRQAVGNEKVLVALSGGVDSSVLAALLHKALGDQLTCVLVDTGLMRHNEVTDIQTVFAKHFSLNIICVDAKQAFMQALQGVSEPEQKRKIIGEQFIRVFEQQAAELDNIKWLAQGTIYPDVIESAHAQSTNSHVIKSHHNVGGLPARMQLKLLEPLRELFKDEVRKLGLQLGLPHQLVYRHPFPGPGLAVRILGEVTQEAVDTLQQADKIFIDELRQANYYDQVSQAFAVFLPVKSVGVKGDARHYGYVIALRAVTTVDFMTAAWADLPHSFLAKVSLRIVNEIHCVSRVVYDISGKPPATIEWE